MNLGNPGRWPGFSLYWQDRTMATDKKKNYVLLTGRDDAAFCQRVSDRMEEGYELYGSPSITFNSWWGRPVVAQALVLKKKPVRKTSKK
ncbi:MAG: hypothetical protein RLZ41_365 [Actinomycetota bacterium]